MLSDNLNDLVDTGVINIKELPRLTAAKEQYKLGEKKRT